MLAWLTRAADRFTGAVRVARSLNLKEIGEAMSASNRVMAIAEDDDFDWGSDTDLGGLIDASLDALDEWADVTPTKVDDRIASIGREVVTANRKWLIEAMHFMASEQHKDEEAARVSLESNDGNTIDGEFTPVAAATTTDLARMQAFADLNPPVAARVAGSERDDSVQASPATWITIALAVWEVIKALRK